MTMAEIDKWRDRVSVLLDTYRALKRVSEDIPGAYPSNTKASLDAARDDVEAALQQWWDQGCKEVS